MSETSNEGVSHPPLPPAEIGAAVRELAAELLAAMRETAAERPSLLVNTAGAIKITGLGRTTFYTLVSAGTLPPPVDVPGVKDSLWRRADLERWAERLKPRR